MENIRFAKLDANDAEVIDASKKARCHDFIMQLPGKYNALVGERGIKLSGGERQRISIARAFLKNAPIFCCYKCGNGYSGRSRPTSSPPPLHVLCHMVKQIDILK